MLFKNKSLQVKFVKDKDSMPEEDFEENIAVDYEKIGELLDKSSISFRQTAEEISTKIIIGVGVYVALDTLRQVIVKLTPTN